MFMVRIKYAKAAMSTVIGIFEDHYKNKKTFTSSQDQELKQEDLLI